MYTRELFGTELKEKLLKGHNIEQISSWIDDIYTEYMLEIDYDFKDMLLKLSIMKESPEFEQSCEELLNIANNLISGRMRTRELFGKQLKAKLLKGHSAEEIAGWACHRYYDCIDDMDEDPDFKEIIETLNIMDAGPEFELSYEELIKIADNLIDENCV